MTVIILSRNGQYKRGVVQIVHSPNASFSQAPTYSYKAALSDSHIF